MDKNAAQSILMQMLHGVNPVTGEILPEDHMIYEPLVQDVFRTAVQSLGAAEKIRLEEPEEPTWIRKNGKLHAGRPWTEEDNQQLLKLHESHVPVEDMARMLSRRVRGVNNQLAALLSAEDAGASRRGKPWMAQEGDTLRWMAEQDRNIEEMARELRRSTVAIEYRLRHLGLIE